MGDSSHGRQQPWEVTQGDPPDGDNNRGDNNRQKETHLMDVQFQRRQEVMHLTNSCDKNRIEELWELGSLGSHEIQFLSLMQFAEHIRTFC